jgi:transcriptional regulator with XRE-family HTH domain
VSEYEKRRLAFGDALRQLREAAGLSGKRLAAQVGWPASKVSRIETAKQSVSDADVRAYCEAAGVSEDTEAELRQELREIRLEGASWKAQLRTGHRARQEYSDQLERDATHIRLFEHAVVPGLVQTAEYARHVFERHAELHQTPRDTDEAVRARMKRQEVLYDSTKTIEILCSEAALRHPIAPREVMATQLDRLLALSGMSTTRLALLPMDAQLPVVPLHGFVLVDDLALIETINTEMSVTNPDELATLHRAFDSLWSISVAGYEARGLIQRLIG